jgi:hypothetical protein
VKQLTVSEAADLLHISEDAVRKLMQRGILAHTKGVDGQVCVYIDEKQHQQKQVDTGPNDSGEDDNAKFSLGQILQIGAAIVVPLGTMIYVTGLLAFWIPINTAYTRDFVAAWYAASIVPQTVVAGHGVTALLGIPVLWAVVIVPLMVLSVHFGLYIRRGTEHISEKNSWLSRFGRRITPVASFFVGFTEGFYIVAFIIFALQYVFLVHLPLATELAILFFLGGPLFGWYVLRPVGIRAFEIDRNAARNKVRLAHRGYAFLTAMLMFAFAFCGSLLAVALKDKPDLPVATIIRLGETESETSKLTGPLLTHTEGFWYVFATEGGRKGQLIAIPDSEIKTIRVRPKE